MSVRQSPNVLPFVRSFPTYSINPPMLYNLDMANFVVTIIDDDKAVRDSLDMLLQIEGFETRSYATGEELLKDEGLPQGACVLLDYNLPGLNGLEVLERLSISRPDVPVILISGKADKSTRDKAIRAGALAALEKPIEDKLLLDTISLAFDC